MKTIADVVYPKLEMLEKQKLGLKEYLMTKAVEFIDFHSVSDVANDLRDIDAKIEILKWILGEIA